MVAAAVCLLVSALAAQDAQRDANTILREFDRVSMPSMSDGNDAESVRRFKEAIEAGSRRKAELALELMQSWPEHPRVPAVLGDRWALLTNALHDHTAVIVETSMLLESGELTRELLLTATHARTHAMLLTPQATPGERLRAVRELVHADPESERTGMALVDLVEDHLADPAMMRPLLASAFERWPNSAWVGRPAKRWLGLLDLVGKPFVERLPAEAHAAFHLATADPAKFTVVQVWMGFLPTAEARPELEVLRALRDESAGDIALVGMFAEFRGDPGTTEKVVIDWPQIALPAKNGMRTPLEAPRLPAYFVLDGDLTIMAVAGRAEPLASFVRAQRR